MNYYDARERQRDGKGTGIFDYTCMNDGKIWPVGYCGGEWKRDKRQSWMSDDDWKRNQEWEDEEERTGRVTRYHSDGHPDKESACNCYKGYELDHHLHLDIESSDTQHKCEICGGWTQMGAEVG